MDSQKIGAFLRILRKEKNLTQEQLAEILGVSGRTVSRWETGSNMPDLSIMIELADYYDIDIKELLNGERKSEMDKELKETLKTVADYTDIQRQEAVKASSYGFIIIFMVSAVAIVVQLSMYADMKLVVGETAAVLVGGIAYLTLIVRAGAWNGSKKESEVISRDLLVSAVTSLVFTVTFFFIALRYSVRNEFQLSIAFFGIIFIISFVVLRALGAISSRHRK